MSVRNIQKNKADLYELDDDEGSFDNSGRIFYFFYGFDTLNTEQRIETLDYDFGNLVVAAGGNLGLFLGLSLLPILMAVVDCLETTSKKCKMPTTGKNQ